MASFFTWRPLENRVLKTRFISPYITKQQPRQKKKSEPQGKKKKKDWIEKKSDHPSYASPRPTTQAVWAPSRASLAAWAARPRLARPRSRNPGSRDLGHVSPRHRNQAPRAPGHASLGRAAWAGSRELFLSLSDLVDLTLSLSDLVSFSLIWLSLSLSDLIRSSEVRLCRLRVFLNFFGL